MSGYIAKQSEKKEYPRPNDGEYIAICNRFIDTGTHINSYGNPQASVRIGWELHGDNLTGEGSGYMSSGDHAGKPFTVDRIFNPSLGSPDKATNFRKFLEAWRGRPFTEDELKGFDITKLLGVPCRLTLATTINEDGSKGYQNVIDAKPMIKGMSAPAQVNASTLFLLPREGSDVEFDQEGFDKLPEFIRKKIGESSEFKGMNGVAIANAVKVVSTDAPFDDEIPF